MYIYLHINFPKKESIKLENSLDIAQANLLLLLYETKIKKGSEFDAPVNYGSRGVRSKEASLTST